MNVAVESWGNVGDAGSTVPAFPRLCLPFNWRQCDISVLIRFGKRIGDLALLTGGRSSHDFVAFEGAPFFENGKSLIRSSNQNPIRLRVSEAFALQWVAAPSPLVREPF